MAKFAVNAQRFDPLQELQIPSVLGNLEDTGGGISTVSFLKRSIGPKLAGRTMFEAITLERGVTYDPKFERWASNEAGLPVRRYRVYCC